MGLCRLSIMKVVTCLICHSSSVIKVVKSIDGVFFDSLVEVIDDYVEKITDYEKRVAAE